MAADTRQRMIDVTTRLLSRQGYHGTGLSQVSAEAHVPKGSMYFHFPQGKEQLVVAAVERSGRSGAEAIETALESAPSALAAACSLVDGFVAQLQASEFHDGCPLASVALELGPSSEAVGAAVAEAFDRWLAPLRCQLLAEGWRPDDAEWGAEVSIAVVEGAIVLAKARRDVAPLVAARTSLALLLAHPPEPAAGGREAGPAAPSGATGG